MKLTVSVPDDLWSRALAGSSVGTSPSAVIQDALRKVTVPADGPPPDLDADAAALFEAARDRLRESAEAVYTTGYRQGLHLALEIGNWDHLLEISQLGIEAAIEKDLQRVQAELAEGTYPKRGKKSPFVVDGRDEDLDDDFDRSLLQSGFIDLDGVLVGSVAGSRHPLLVQGAEAAIRDLLAAATTSTFSRKP